jgi:hypothetical protein
MSLPLWPNSMSPPEPPVMVSLPAPPNRLAAGSAPLLSLSVMMSSPPWPNAWISLVLATVAVPPLTATAPPFTRIVPAALRLNVIVLLRLSPNVDRICEVGEKVAVMAIVVPLDAASDYAVAVRCAHGKCVVGVRRRASA